MSACKTRFKKFILSKHEFILCFRSKHIIQCIIIMGKFVWLSLDLVCVQIQVSKSEYLALKFTTHLLHNGRLKGG
jgi:hypothetical protein